ncbi:MAG TPA: hypothetical protein VNN74_08820 [Candidatus Micrarchaeia archaeon]|nr:hypothetical protein [Candidatus Micrarchaeia archaeon]
MRRTALVLVAVGAALPAMVVPSGGRPAGRPWFGVLEPNGRHFQAERRAGLTVTDLELAWAAAEPRPHRFDLRYLAAARVRLRAMRAQGMQVALDLGLQYPPAWVFHLNRGTRFVDQYGDVWRSARLGSDVPDAVHDPAVRRAQAAYVDEVASQLGSSIFAVRVGGLLDNELRYPPAHGFGHANCYWAFGRMALARSPAPGWRPGDPGPAKARVFLSAYLGALVGYERWQLRLYRRAFRGWLELLLPSWGLRPGDIRRAVATDLDGSTRAALWGTLAMGLDWQRQLAAIGVPRVIAYTTWLDRPGAGSAPDTISPAAYLSRLARPRGIPVAGENAAGAGAAGMRVAVSQVRRLGLMGMMWMDEASLLAHRPSLGTYAALASRPPMRHRTGVGLRPRAVRASGAPHPLHAPAEDHQ